MILEALLLVLAQSVLELGLAFFAVAAAAFFSHLLDPEPMPRLGGWSRSRWPSPEI